jgi:two-component system OmpR family response regulator
MPDRNGQRTALVVDDETPLLSVLHEILTETGFRTTCYDRGQPALEALSRRCFDLLVLDVGLPDMNGLRLCAAARERYGDDCVILVLTGADRTARSVGAFALGADDFLGKPFSVDELIARIDAKFRRAAGE